MFSLFHILPPDPKTGFSAFAAGLNIIPTVNGEMTGRLPIGNVADTKINEINGKRISAG
jgi:hypothetical protein